MTSWCRIVAWPNSAKKTIVSYYYPYKTMEKIANFVYHHLLKPSFCDFWERERDLKSELNWQRLQFSTNPFVKQSFGIKLFFYSWKIQTWKLRKLNIEKRQTLKDRWTIEKKLWASSYLQFRVITVITVITVMILVPVFEWLKRVQSLNGTAFGSHSKSVPKCLLFKQYYQYNTGHCGLILRWLLKICLK